MGRPRRRRPGSHAARTPDAHVRHHRQGSGRSPARGAGRGLVRFRVSRRRRGQRPTAGDSARVPGLFGAIDGDVQYYPHGHGGTAVGLANVRVVLVDPTTCPVFTRAATTDLHGHFRIAHAPAGASYLLYIYPPAGWKVRFENPTHALVFGNDTSHFGIEVEHGSAAVPSAPTACASPPPSTPPAGPPLANTGAAPSGLAALGGSAILLGLVLTLLTTRRRTH